MSVSLPKTANGTFLFSSLLKGLQQQRGWNIHCDARTISSHCTYLSGIETAHVFYSPEIPFETSKHGHFVSRLSTSLSNIRLVCQESSNLRTKRAAADYGHLRTSDKRPICTHDWIFPLMSWTNLMLLPHWFPLSFRPLPKTQAHPLCCWLVLPTKFLSVNEHNRPPPSKSAAASKRACEDCPGHLEKHHSSHSPPCCHRPSLSSCHPALATTAAASQCACEDCPGQLEKHHSSASSPCCHRPTLSSCHPALATMLEVCLGDVVGYHLCQENQNTLAKTAGKTWSHPSQQAQPVPRKAKNICLNNCWFPGQLQLCVFIHKCWKRACEIPWKHETCKKTIKAY